MATRTQPKTDDLVLKDFQLGIGASPELSFEDMRSINISDSPGSVFLNFAMTAIGTPPAVTALAFTVVAGTDVFTVASTAGWYNGMAITLNTVVTSTGIVTSRVYWVGSLSGNTFKLYTNPNLGATPVDVTGSNGSGTLTSFAFGKPIDKTVFYNAYTPAIFILDENGLAWGYGYLNIGNSVGILSAGLVYLGNDVLDAPTATGKAIKVFRDHLVVFRSGTADLLNLSALGNDGIDLDSGSGWVYSWGAAPVGTVIQMVRPTVVASDNNLYFGNPGGVGVIYNVNTPLTAPDYDVLALDLPLDEFYVESLGELGRYLLIAGQRELIYPWDKSSPSFETPLVVPSMRINKIVNAGNRAYIFGGATGRIYVTDGLNVQLFKRLPFQITANQNPKITWDDAQIWRSYLYFSFSALDSMGGTIVTVGGVWGINLETEALTLTNKLSYGGYGGNRTLIIPNVVNLNAPGQGIFAAWASGNTPLNSFYGLDVEAATYATGYSGFLISPLFEVGTSLVTHEYTQVEIVLEKPLATGEGVRVSYRPERATAFGQTTTFDFATNGAVQFLNLSARFPDLVSLQLKVALTGSATTPVIKTIRIR